MLPGQSLQYAPPPPPVRANSKVCMLSATPPPGGAIPPASTWQGCVGREGGQRHRPHPGGPHTPARPTLTTQMQSSNKQQSSCRQQHKGRNHTPRNPQNGNRTQECLGEGFPPERTVPPFRNRPYYIPIPDLGKCWMLADRLQTPLSGFRRGDVCPPGVPPPPPSS